MVRLKTRVETVSFFSRLSRGPRNSYNTLHSEALLGRLSSWLIMLESSLQLKGVLDRILGDEGDMKAIHLTGRYHNFLIQLHRNPSCSLTTVIYPMLHQLLSCQGVAIHQVYYSHFNQQCTTELELCCSVINGRLVDLFASWMHSLSLLQDEGAEGSSAEAAGKEVAAGRRDPEAGSRPLQTQQGKQCSSGASLNSCAHWRKRRVSSCKVFVHFCLNLGAGRSVDD